MTIYMNRSFIITIVIAIVVVSCSGSSKDRLVGKWKIVKCVWEGSDQGLRNDYYQANVGRVIAYTTDSSRWENHLHAAAYTFDEQKSEIRYKKKVLQVLNITSSELVIREKDTTGSLTTTFVRIE